ncbi:MAG: LysM peptidoglycan-binding domain-containing protein [Deltaproteobacteria bacterium]|nr:MAG: LysM peptidoglycan-binding domain-containing protein [Deltaproteobacteria bacterium]
MLEQRNDRSNQTSPSSGAAPATSSGARAPMVQAKGMSYDAAVQMLSPSGGLYTVKRGDTLAGIASSQLGDAGRWSDIYQANRGVIRNPNAISVGMKLKLPSAGGGTGNKAPQTKYTVRRGDTLSSIAEEQLGKTGLWKSIWEANKKAVPSPNKLEVGQVLTLPGKSGGSSGGGGGGGAAPEKETEVTGGKDLLGKAAVRRGVDWYKIRRLQYNASVVKRIQREVGAGPDGAVGPLTVQAIARWQAKHGLTVDGVAGSNTIQKMFGEDIRPKAAGGGGGDADAGKMAFKRPNGYNEIVGIFGQPGSSIGSYAMPAGPGGEVVTVRCHKKLAPVLQAVYAEIQAAGLSKHLHSYDGCYVYRTKRKNSKSWSTHAWGIAIDVNASSNVATFKKSTMKVSDSQKLIAPIFEKHGFLWGASFGDPMHFQYATGW